MRRAGVVGGAVSSLSAAKKRGAAFETAVAQHLRDVTGQNVQRLRLTGTQDIGDMHLALPHGMTVIEAKNANRICLTEWCDEAEKEAANAGLPGWAVVVRRRNQSDIGKAFVVVSLDEWLRQTGAAS